MSRVGRLIPYVEAAARLAVPPGTLRSWVSRKQVPHIRLSKQVVVFDVDELDVWLAERCVKAGAR